MVPLLDRRLLIVSGKGGTGKSSISAGLALAASRAGRRTLVCELNASDRVTQLLGFAPTGPRIAALQENLWAVNIRPEDAMREYALMVLRLESIYRAVFENRFVRYFLRFIPSLHELVMLGKVLYHVKEKLDGGDHRFELVVMDAPATGHAISFLSVPKVLVETVPPGALRREAERMREILEDQKLTAAVLVSLPEEMPVNETLELFGSLQSRVNILPQAVVLNSFTVERFTTDELQALQATPLLLKLAEDQRRLAHFSKEFRETLQQRLRVPVLTVPRLYEPTFGRSSIEGIAAHLERELSTS
jgi:anion-transporting  ArsA/GET3 family ATPase